MEAILFITQAAGILLLVGTMVLLFFRRVVLESETGKPTSVKLPFLGEMTTQAPVLVLVFIGATMVMYPMSKHVATLVHVSGTVDPGSSSVAVLVIADPDYAHSYDAAGNFDFAFPLLDTSATYRVKFIADKQVIDDQPLVVKKGKVALRQVSYSPRLADPAPLIAMHKDVPDAHLQTLGIN